MKLSEIAEKIGAELTGEGEQVITGIAPLQTADVSEISFLSNAHYRSYLTSTKAAAVIVSPADAKFCPTATLVVPNPYLAFAKSAALFARPLEYPIGIHATAVIGKNCTIDPMASIGPYCVIGDNAVIHKGAILEASCVLGQDVTIGENSHLWPQVSVYYGVKIGAQVNVHSGVVIGSDGFGLARDGHRWEKIPQIGSVVIENNVEIGANTTIDRGALGNTIIEEGVKLDNQIQIGHNVRIGAHTAIAGCVAVAGSTQIGRFCMIGGGSAIGGHLTIADKVAFTGMAMITKSIAEAGVYSSGTGFQKRRDWQKSAVRFRQLDSLARRLHVLEEKYGEVPVELVDD
jgi:UDP-3-O-[3-hydroxymyristoyl] glucosamine N-acyltransferase